jgi:hypothetical protein
MVLVGGGGGGCWCRGEGEIERFRFGHSCDNHDNHMRAFAGTSRTASCGM